MQLSSALTGGLPCWIAALLKETRALFENPGRPRVFGSEGLDGFGAPCSIKACLFDARPGPFQPMPVLLTSNKEWDVWLRAIDHLIPLCLGGTNTTASLWPPPSALIEQTKLSPA